MSKKGPDQSEVQEEVTHLFRHEYGKLVSVLTKAFGAANIELAEDVVQDAMLEAVNQWSYQGVPENPIGWIYKVARYKAINIVRREKYQRKFITSTASDLKDQRTSEPELEQIFIHEEIADDQLRMMFTCCHPAVSTDSQIALTLKTLCGFSIPEIARAFLTNQENINKRLVRARKNIRKAGIPFEVPSGRALETRLQSILETIYLLFNEGYYASANDDLIRYELCEEAIRLTEIIASNPNIHHNSQVYALLALMTLNAARFKSRTDEFDNLIDLEHQDRNKWDRSLIQAGLNYLEFAMQKEEISIYHILAAVSAHHCTARDFQSTDWQSILSLYNNLLDFDSSPLVQLNRAVVISMTAGPATALLTLENIKNQSSLWSYLPYYTSKAELHFRNNDRTKALKTLEEALKLPISNKIKALVSKKLLEYSKNS